MSGWNVSSIYTKAENDRIKTETNMVSIDLHGMSVKEARRFVKNNICLARGIADFKIIHGYRHGTAIKEMISRDVSDMTKRETVCRVDENNPGVTYIHIAA